MGRFHRHSDGTVHCTHDHAHDDGHSHDGHSHDDEPAGDHGHVGDHTGYATGVERVEVLEAILGENDRVAAANRADLAGHGVRTVNLMSSPGAGKTSLLRRTIPALASRLRVGILEGDIATSIDADALAGLGAAVSLVNTGRRLRRASATSTRRWCARA